MIDVSLNVTVILFQALWYQVRWMRSRHQSVGPGAQSPRQGVPSQLFHVPGVQEATQYGRGALRP